MAVSSVFRPARASGLVAAIGPISPSAAVVAAAVPLIFLHKDYQPSLTVSATEATLSDFAVAAVVLAALTAGVRAGFQPLRAGRIAWIGWSAFLGWIAVATVYGHLRFGGYPFRTHAITAAKWYEYALLAPALPLLLRRHRDLTVVLWSLALWSAVATAIGVLGFFGVPVPSKGATAHRQASLLGWSDFGALSAAAVLAGVVVRRGPLARVLVAAGALGAIVAGSLAATLGIVTGVAALPLLERTRDRRRLAGLALVIALVIAGSVAIRVGDLNAFQRFLSDDQTTAQQTHIQTYAHHTLLTYVGYRIWLDHPALGAGWQASNDANVFMPEIPAARRHFPDESPLAFPAPGRRYGVQNAYVQALADMGVLGLAALLGVFAAGLCVAVRERASAAGTIGALWLVLVLWLWMGQGLVAGVPMNALIWLGIGSAATAAAWRRVDG